MGGQPVLSCNLACTIEIDHHMPATHTRASSSTAVACRLMSARWRHAARRTSNNGQTNEEAEFSLRLVLPEFHTKSDRSHPCNLAMIIVIRLLPYSDHCTTPIYSIRSHLALGACQHQQLRKQGVNIKVISCLQMQGHTTSSDGCQHTDNLGFPKLL